MSEKHLFDDWPERYEAWFSTPIGRLVQQTEAGLVLAMLDPGKGERILDVGCGTGIFTLDYLAAGAEVTGLDISQPMLDVAVRKAAGYPFTAVRGDMRSLPFDDESFDKTVSVTALEFVEDGGRAVGELFRVTKPGGVIVVGTLNGLSPWAARRRAKTDRGQDHVLRGAVFRSPAELLALAPRELTSLTPVAGTALTVVHFQKTDSPELAEEVEKQGQAAGLQTGAFVAARWVKPM